MVLDHGWPDHPRSARTQLACGPPDGVGLGPRVLRPWVGRRIRRRSSGDCSSPPSARVRPGHDPRRGRGDPQQAEEA
ncbi:hypothetical protein QJS66_07180 [Kocuria rhizophila]|nr:hypothetical protein QJS66_07180 [Kocuria rhizophila]